MAKSKWIIGIACYATGIGTANGSMISLTDLHRNNRIFADYLNHYAPATTIELFSSLEGDDLRAALESAAPTRNSHPVFMATRSLFFASQLLTDHLQQQRIRQHSNEGSPLSLRREPDPSLFIADASEGVSGATNISDSIPIPDPTSSADIASTPAEDTISDKTAIPDISTVSDRAPEPCVDLGDYALWAGAIGEYTRQKAVQQAPSFHAGTGGVMAGVDYSQGENASFGSGMAYLYSALREKRNGGRSTVNQGLAFIYKEMVRSRFYADVSLWGGYYSINNHRQILFSGVDEMAASAPHGWQCLPHLEAGGQFRRAHAALEPFFMFDWANSWENHEAEHGARGLNMKQKKHYSSMLRSEIGFRLYQKLDKSQGTLTLLEKVSYVNNVFFHTGSVPAFLVGSLGSFTVETQTKTQNLGLGQLEISYDPINKNRPKYAISYQGEFSSLYQLHQLMLTVEKTF